MKLNELIKDKDFIAELLNGPCIPKDKTRSIAPLNLEWIDDKVSDTVTESFQRLIPQDMPYISYVIAECNPDTIQEGACVNDEGKRRRYFVVTIIPDSEFPYNFSFPLIHYMRTIGLACWEIIRATLYACTKDMRVLLANDPKPPILNNAIIEWVSLYLGRKPYEGISELSQQWLNANEYDGNNMDIHLYKVREMERDALLQRLIDAYEADFPEEK